MIAVLLAVAACLALALPAAARGYKAMGECDEAGCTDGCQACCGTPIRCGICGCKAPANAYCMVECGRTTITRPCWKVECEPFCLPKPRCWGGWAGLICNLCAGQKTSCGSCGEAVEVCGCEAGSQDGCDGQSGLCCHVVPVESPPKCGKLRTRKRLLRAECQIEVPTYRCVVKYCCPSCAEDPGCSVPTKGRPEEEAEAAFPAPSPEDHAWGGAPVPPAF